MMTFQARGRFVGLFLLLAAMLAGQSFPGADEKWRHFQSPHFEVYSRSSESESRELLYNLELVHAIFFETFGFEVSRAVPVTVYFFSRDKYFEAYKPESYRKVDAVSAFYHGDIDRGVMTIAPLPTYDAAQRLAFGSYTYHLFRLSGGDRPPTWYSYGMSGIFSNLNLLSESFELGKANPDQIARLQTARLIPVEVLFGADQQSNAFLANRENHLFHDETWALLHYLYFGEHKLPREQVQGFLAFLLAQRNYDAALTRQRFEAAMGFNYATMDKQLDRYFRSGRYGYKRVPLPVIPKEKTYTMRKVPLEEINLRLAELAMRVNRSPAGKLALLHVKADSPEAARVQEALGAEAAKDGDRDAASDRWWRAFDAGSNNPAIMHELGRLEDAARFRNFDLYYRLPEEDATRLRTLAHRVIANAPEQASVYELLAWVEATAQEPNIKNVNLVQRNFMRTQDKDRTLLAIAVIRMRLGDKAGAAELLDQIANLNPDNWVLYGIEHTRARLEDRPVDRSKLPQGRPASRDPVLQRGIAKPKM